MTRRPISADEHARLRELAALELGGEIDEPALQALVERAALELSLPIAAVSIILDSAQYFIASHGLSGWLAIAEGTPREWAFCQHAITNKQPFFVEDATVHPLTRDNPLVEHEGVRCYLGYPLVTRNGHALGTLCVIGVQPRAFLPAELTRLGELADQVMALLETRRDR